MADSKCAYCHKVLKGGEWEYQKNDDGKVIKVCWDKEGCRKRTRYNSFHVCKN